MHNVFETYDLFDQSITLQKLTVDLIERVFRILRRLVVLVHLY